MAISFSGAGNPATIDGTNYGITLTHMSPSSITASAVNFTGIPSWAKKITVIFNEVKCNKGDLSFVDPSALQIQLGSTTFSTTGYRSGSHNFGVQALSSSTATTGFALVQGNPAYSQTLTGLVQIVWLTGNTWVASGTVSRTDGNGGSTVVGQISLPGTLDRLRIVPVNGTDIFNSGNIIVMYE